MRILLIHGDPAFSDQVSESVKSAGMNIYVTGTGEEGIELAKFYDYDIVLLADKLPDMDGFEVLKKLRADKVVTPILMLSQDKSTEAKIKFFGFGGDDIMARAPLHFPELIARINAIVRRCAGHATKTFQVANLVIDFDLQEVRVAGSIVPLTRREYDILAQMCMHPGTVQSKEHILNHIYGGMDEPELKIIDVFVCKIRKKLNIAKVSREVIETSWGRGYVVRIDSDANPGETHDA